MSRDFSHAERLKVTEAIRSAEHSTSGEIIVVVALQSDDYIHVPLHIATGLALAVPLVLPVVERLLPWSSVSLSLVFIIQLVVFIVAAVIFSIHPLRYFLTPRKLMKKYAHRNAAAQFLARNAHGTRGRTGILLFVSLLERHVEVIGDTAISQKLSQADWQGIIAKMLPLLKNGKLTEAMTTGVGLCGLMLSQHFPPGADNPNELPDHFIVLG